MITFRRTNMNNGKTLYASACKRSTRLEFSSSTEIFQHVDDMIRHRWGSREVSTTGTEPVLISNPGYRYLDSIRSSVRIASLGHCSRFFGLDTDLLLNTVRLDSDTVFAFETVKYAENWQTVNRTKGDVILWFSLLVIEASVRLVVIEGSNDGRRWLIQCCSRSATNQNGGDEQLKTFQKQTHYFLLTEIQLHKYYSTHKSHVESGCREATARGNSDAGWVARWVDGWSVPRIVLYTSSPTNLSSLPFPLSPKFNRSIYCTRIELH